MTTDNTQETRAELVERLRQLAEEIGRSPTMADLRDTPGYPPVRRFLTVFGSWNAAKQAAGLDTYRKEGRGVPYSDVELLEQLQRLARKTEGSVTMQDANDSDECPSAVTYQRRFGSWNAAKERAGLETVEADETPVEFTDEELCDLLRARAAAVDGQLTIRDVETADNLPDHTTFERRFGSWNKAKEAAGLEPIEQGHGDRSHTYSDAELLHHLRERVTEVDGPLTAAAMDEADDAPSSSTYKRRFGSWTAAKEQAGLESPT